jgi:ribonucrease Y
MEFIIPLVAAFVGAAMGFFLNKSKASPNTTGLTIEEAETKKREAEIAARKTIADAQSKAQDIIEKAEAKNEAIKLKKIQEVKERSAVLKAEADVERANQLAAFKDRELVVVNKENELRNQVSDFKATRIEAQKELDTIKVQREEVAKREEDVVAKRSSLDQQIAAYNKKKEELDHANDTFIEKLEAVAKLTQAEAKVQILDAVRAKAETESLSIIKNAVAEAQNSASKEAKRIVIQTIQRQAAEFAIENTVTVFPIDSDDIKGQIIGREGRNIRAIEQATGAELVVDDTPEAIIISSFDPVRRELARLALKKLVADGRIHPARIEEVVTKTKKQLEEQIMEIGEKTIIDLDIHGLNTNLVRMVGRMRYRSSYGQNLLRHSIETANLCATMAAELGLSANQIKQAKRAGLLHDIGKVNEEESEMSHAILGMKLCEKYGEHAAIINAVGAHHDEIEMVALISPIVQACDAISGARPGARREIMESYLKRIKELEELASTYDGVTKAYAMQAGRELRVILEAEKVTDQYADDLAFIIANRIQEEMQYPGQIRVTVIREKRATGIAR